MVLFRLSVRVQGAGGTKTGANSSYTTGSPAGRMGGGVGGFNANMGMNNNNNMQGRMGMGGGASLNSSIKSEAQGVTETVRFVIYM